MGQKKFRIIIKNISEGKEKGLMATIPECHNAIVFGEDYKELFEGIYLTFDLWKETQKKKKFKSKNLKINTTKLNLVTK